MEYTYSKKIEIAYPDCDIHNRLRLSNVMRIIQQIGGEHLEKAMGLTYEKMAQDGMVLLLSKERLAVKRMPQAGETVTLVTNPRAPKGAQLLRDVSFIDKQGEEIIYAETAWTAANTQTHRIIRPAELPYPLFPEAEAKEFAVTAMRVKEPENAEAIGVRTIRFSDIDCNNHLNNAVYGDIIYDFLPTELSIKKELTEFYISFQSEAVLGDDVAIRLGKLDDGRIYISGAKEDKTCFSSALKFK